MVTVSESLLRQLRSHRFVTVKSDSLTDSLSLLIKMKVTTPVQQSERIISFTFVYPSFGLKPTNWPTVIKRKFQ